MNNADLNKEVKKTGAFKSLRERICLRSGYTFAT